MIKEISLAIIQGITEFLPVSSSGHLALFGNYFDTIDLSYFTLLHLASLIAIVIYTRKEIYKLITLEEDYKQMWVFLLIGIIPAGIVGYSLNGLISSTFSSITFLGFAFMISGIIVLSTKNFPSTKGKLTKKRSLIIGLAQILALLPGISRSGTTISFGLFSHLKKDEAFKFSFLMAIPLIIGASILEFSITTLTIPLFTGFVLCIGVSLVSLTLLEKIIKANYFWVFGIYSLLIGVAITLSNLF